MIESADFVINILETYKDGITKDSLKIVTGGIKLAGMHQGNPAVVLSAGVAEAVVDAVYEGNGAGLGTTAGYVLAYGALTTLAPKLAIIASLGFTAYAGYKTVQDGYNLYHEWNADTLHAPTYHNTYEEL